MCAEVLWRRLWYNSLPHSGMKSCSPCRTQVGGPVTQSALTAFHSAVGEGRPGYIVTRVLGFILIIYSLNEIYKHSMD